MTLDLRFKIVVPLLVLGLLILFLFCHDRKSWGARKVAMLGIFTSLAVVIGMVEGMLPDMIIPGMKLGLANVIILLLLYEYSWHEALVVDLLRVVLVCLLRGNVFNMPGLMSLAGAVLSYMGMFLCVALSKKKLTPIFSSLVGALLHDLGQILVGIVYLGSSAVVYYLPFMALISLGTGVASGLLCLVLIKTKILSKQRKKYEGE